MLDKAHDVSVARARLLAAMAEYSETYPEQTEQKFPHILARIAEMWGSEALVAYLDQLMFTDREGRQGFPPEVASELFAIFQVHAGLGFVPKDSGTGWASLEDLALERKASVDNR